MLSAFASWCRRARRPFVIAAVCVGAGLAAVGCAVQPAGPPEEVVKELANKRWQALVAGEFSQAYDYATPAFRSARPREDYVYKQRNAGIVKWLSAAVVAVKCEETRCKTTTELTSKPLIPGLRGTLKQGIEETWVLENGRWWFAEPL